MKKSPELKKCPKCLKTYDGYINLCLTCRTRLEPHYVKDWTESDVENCVYVEAPIIIRLLGKVELPLFIILWASWVALYLIYIRPPIVRAIQSMGLPFPMIAHMIFIFGIPILIFYVIYKIIKFLGMVKRG